MRETLTNSARLRLALLFAQHCGQSVPPDDLELICSGASGRIVMRYQGIIGIYWSATRADNNSFLPAASGLYQAGIQVPRILAQWSNEDGHGACLVSDCGKDDILSFKGQDWAQVKAVYELAFQALLPLYQLKPSWDLQPPFDESLYRWEQAYFAEHFLGRHLAHPQAQSFTQAPAFTQLAQYLDQLPRVPVHRDCQSQNIFIQSGKAWLIDFQGMRLGRMEYDLASLIYDPYMDLSPAQRQELLASWQELYQQPLDRAIFCACGMQRILQALGAFANIGYNQERDWYLQMIPAALRSLEQLGQLAPHASLAQQLFTCLKNDAKLPLSSSMG